MEDVRQYDFMSVHVRGGNEHREKRFISGKSVLLGQNNLGSFKRKVRKVFTSGQDFSRIIKVMEGV